MPAEATNLYRKRRWQDVRQEALNLHDLQELQFVLRRLTICASAYGRAVGDEACRKPQPRTTCKSCSACEGD